MAYSFFNVYVDPENVRTRVVTLFGEKEKEQRAKVDVRPVKRRNGNAN